MKALGFLAVTGCSRRSLTGCATTAGRRPPRRSCGPDAFRVVTDDLAAHDLPAATPERPPPGGAATPEPIPTACVGEQAIKDGQACLPPGTFVNKLCAAPYPDVALAMFSKGTPWTRAWLAGDVEAWNASGGFTSRAQLAFDEEVLVLSRHVAPSTGGIQISGNTSFDVLRWDGSCVSLMEGELTTKRPPTPKAATMSWNRLEESTKHALLTSPKVKTSHDALEKACSGEKEACTRAEQSFAHTIAHAVRSGSAALPTPTHRP